MKQRSISQDEATVDDFGYAYIRSSQQYQGGLGHTQRMLRSQLTRLASYSLRPATRLRDAPARGCVGISTGNPDQVLSTSRSSSDDATAIHNRGKSVLAFIKVQDFGLRHRLASTTCRFENVLGKDQPIADRQSRKPGRDTFPAVMSASVEVWPG
ncbi:hypothetical protein ABW21_db0200383 [Orbilia brochopaga]|nr:hypothetical protein ABW21_db0200383 [Drechslerella brochopaga]